jgi:short-subunit dehydrogenase
MKNVWKYWLAPRINLMERYGGGWALITGAARGLGKQYALNLAREGFNLILVGRSEESLDNVISEITDIKNYVKIKTIIYDFDNLTDDQSIVAF